MPIRHLALDIETVPLKSIGTYSKTVQDKVREKISRQQERNPDYDYNYFASIHGDFGKIICISLAYVTDGNSIRLKSFAGNDEYRILTDFNELIENHAGIFIHYNGLNFDIPFISQRMAHHGIAAANYRFGNLRKFTTDPHFDLMMIYYNWDMQKVLPLGILAELHELPSPKSDLSGGEVYQTYLERDWQRIKHYCEFDTATVLNLWWKIYEHNPPIPLENYLFSE